MSKPQGFGECDLSCWAQSDQLGELLAALGDIYTIARRETARPLTDERANQMWRHVMRLCEAVGCQPSDVLRDNVDAITEGCANG